MLAFAAGFTRILTGVYIYKADLVSVTLGAETLSMTPADVWGEGTSYTFEPGRIGFYNNHQPGVVSRLDAIESLPTD